LWQHGKRALLWVGLGLCGFALWRTRSLSGEAIQQLSSIQWALIALLLVLIWILAVASWHAYLRSYSISDARWRTAARQLGLLLIGKYLPGGIFGFLMRLYDSPKEQRHKLLWASLADQGCGIALPILLGLLILFVVIRESWPAAVLLLALPFLAVFGIELMQHCATRIPWISRYTGSPMMAPWRSLLPATTLQLAQIIAWVGLVTFLASQLYGLDSHEALCVAGAFLLAVSAGMLVVILPSGIGAREAALVALASQWIETNQAIHLAALLRIIGSVLDVLAGLAAAAIESGRPKDE